MLNLKNRFMVLNLGSISKAGRTKNGPASPGATTITPAKKNVFPLRVSKKKKWCRSMENPSGTQFTQIRPKKSNIDDDTRNLLRENTTGTFSRGTILMIITTVDDC